MNKNNILFKEQEIRDALKKIKELYDDDSEIFGPKISAVYFSKLALLEFCAWIEESMDELVRYSVRDKIINIEFKRIMEKEIIGRTSGFAYERYYRPMMMRTIGLVEMEKIEEMLESRGEGQDLDFFNKKLEILQAKRNEAAHQPTGALKNYPAPSEILDDFDRLLPFFHDIKEHFDGNNP